MTSSKMLETRHRRPRPRSRGSRRGRAAAPDNTIAHHRAFAVNAEPSRTNRSHAGQTSSACRPAAPPCAPQAAVAAPAGRCARCDAGTGQGAANSQVSEARAKMTDDRCQEGMAADQAAASTARWQAHGCDQTPMLRQPAAARPMPPGGHPSTARSWRMHRIDAQARTPAACNRPDARDAAARGHAVRFEQALRASSASG